jgi:hypothetical protein
MVPIYTGYGHPLVGFVDGRYRFIENRRTHRTELYDVAADPKELDPIGDDHPDWIESYRKRADALVAAQAAWEKKLPDLDEHARPPHGGTAGAWTAHPVDCSYPDRFFAARDGALYMRHGAEKHVRCSTGFPVTGGELTAMRVHGTEGINASFITATIIWEGPGGRRRQLGYCTLNGNTRKPAHQCEAELVPTRARFDDGGRLIVDLRYVTPRGKPPPEVFNVSAVDVAYDVDNAPPL